MGCIVSKLFWDFYIFFVFTRPLRGHLMSLLIHYKYVVNVGMGSGSATTMFRKDK